MSNIIFLIIRILYRVAGFSFILGKEEQKGIQETKLVTEWK